MKKSPKKRAMSMKPELEPKSVMRKEAKMMAPFPKAKKSSK